MSSFAAHYYTLHLKTGSSVPLFDVRLWGPRRFQPVFNSERVRLDLIFDGTYLRDLKKEYGDFELEDSNTTGITAAKSDS